MSIKIWRTLLIQHSLFCGVHMGNVPGVRVSYKQCTIKCRVFKYDIWLYSVHKPCRLHKHSCFSHAIQNVSYWNTCVIVNNTFVHVMFFFYHKHFKSWIKKYIRPCSGFFIWFLNMTHVALISWFAELDLQYLLNIKNMWDELQQQPRHRPAYSKQYTVNFDQNLFFFQCYIINYKLVMSSVKYW